MSPAALYEYFPSRDAMLVALLTIGYDHLGEALTAAAGSEGPPRSRFIAVARAYRTWATDHPEEFALLYATRVRGFSPPDRGETTTAAARAGSVLRSLIGEMTGSPLPRPTDPAFLGAWAQLHGMIALEVFGHLAVTGADPASSYDAVAEDLVDRLTSGGA